MNFTAFHYINIFQKSQQIFLIFIKESVTIIINRIYGGKSLNNIELGKRLKEARLHKKMTQSDVVGTFITRNMLSQIESGVASPSLRTLEYLANTLDLPMHYLINEQQNIPCPKPKAVTENLTEPVTPELFGIILSLKALYDSGQYDKLGEVLNGLVNHANVTMNKN
jgi:transcriptional regulator with XRE-family HTH domain